MVDWLSSMQQTFEYYVVDPNTWTDKRLITTAKSCSISRDSSAETLGSATIDIAEQLGECYVRVYLITIQNGVRRKHPLGTVLIQTPSSRADGKTLNVSMDAYTPLLELKENPPPLGYSILKGENIMDRAYALIRENARAPVVKVSNSETLYNHFVANTDDTWLSFVSDLIANAKYSLALDEMGRILFAPIQETASLQPIWTYTDDNSSILFPELTIDHDLYGIPNIVEVIYSSGNAVHFAKAVNDDPDSPTSTVSRGRQITHRITNPDFGGNPTDGQIQDYANRVLRELSSIEYTVTYKHGYCPVRLGDCVRLNYSGAKLSGIKAKVISQSIECVPGCPVTETAIFTHRLWR